MAALLAARLEYLYGQSPERAYTGPGKRDFMARGEVADLDWAVGESGPEGCEQFLTMTRSRYLRLAGKVRETNDSDPRSVLVKDRAVGISLIDRGPDAGRYRVRYKSGRWSVGDKVVLATGPKLRDGVDLFPEAGELELIKGRLPSRKGSSSLGKRVRGEDIYQIGAALGVDVVDRDERYDTAENAASVFNLRDRDIAIAEGYLASGERLKSTLSGMPNEEKPIIKAPAAQAWQGARLPRRQNDQALARMVPTASRLLMLKSGIADVLSGFRFPGRGNVSVRAKRDGHGVFVEILGVSPEDARAITSVIESDRDLVHELYGATERRASIGFEVEVRKGGSTDRLDFISLPTMRLSY